MVLLKLTKMATRVYNSTVAHYQNYYTEMFLVCIFTKKAKMILVYGTTMAAIAKIEKKQNKKKNNNKKKIISLTFLLIDAVWKKEENQSFHDNRDHILNLMEHLNIIARPFTYSDSEENQDGPATKVEF